MKDLYTKLAAHLQAMNLSYKNSHHLASRVSFFADHEAFRSFYQEADEDYDDVMERCIGLHGPEGAMLQPQLSLIVARLAQFPSAQAQDNAALFNFALTMETELVAQCEALCKQPDTREAEKQLFGEIGNKSAKRQYKLKQRLRK